MTAKVTKPTAEKIIKNTLETKSSIAETLRNVEHNLSTMTFIDPQILKGIQEKLVVRPFLPPSFTNILVDWQNQTKTITDCIQATQKTWQNALKTSFAPLQDVFAHIAKQHEKAKLVEATGWLPHYTTPFHLIGAKEQDVTKINDLISLYYKESWAIVEKLFLENLSTYKLDNEAKETFQEALKAHSKGLYRAVPRLLFPEIERVVVVEIYGGKRKIQGPAGNMIGITSLPGICCEAKDLPASAVTNYDFAVDLFKKMEAHLYERVSTETEITKFAADPVPNRHAALHGIISYTTAQNSLNALIMTDFIFHLTNSMKKYVLEESTI